MPGLCLPAGGATHGRSTHCHGHARARARACSPTFEGRARLAMSHRPRHGASLWHVLLKPCAATDGRTQPASLARLLHIVWFVRGNRLVTGCSSRGGFVAASGPPLEGRRGNRAASAATQRPTAGATEGAPVQQSAAAPSRARVASRGALRQERQPPAANRPPALTPVLHPPSRPAPSAPACSCPLSQPLRARRPAAAAPAARRWRP